jgi:hypothetical protein
MPATAGRRLPIRDVTGDGDDVRVRRWVDRPRDRNAVIALAIGLDESGADTLRRAGDDCDFSLEAHCKFPLPYRFRRYRHFRISGETGATRLMTELLHDGVSAASATLLAGRPLSKPTSSLRQRSKSLILSAVEADRDDQESPTPSIRSSTS